MAGRLPEGRGAPGRRDARRSVAKLGDGACAAIVETMRPTELGPSHEKAPQKRGQVVWFEQEAPHVDRVQRHER